MTKRERDSIAVVLAVQHSVDGDIYCSLADLHACGAAYAFSEEMLTDLNDSVPSQRADKDVLGVDEQGHLAEPIWTSVALAEVPSLRNIDRVVVCYNDE